MSSPSVKGAESVARDVEGAVVVEDSGDVVECASDAKAPVAVMAVDCEGEAVTEGSSVAGDGESNEADTLEISFIILRTDTEHWL